MPYRKTFTTKNGKTITLRDLNRNDSAKELMDFINSFVEEKALVLADKKWTLKEEKKFIADSLSNISRGNLLLMVMEHQGKVIGSMSAERGNFKLRNNILLGIVIRGGYRNQGIGRFAMGEMIKRVKKEMRPKNIYLTVFKPNKTARRLYEKLGFVRKYTLKDWACHYGEYVDEEVMVLKS